LRRSPVESPSVDALRNVQELVYELQVHEVELRLQNEALQDAHIELQQWYERYRALFEGAPVALLALELNGLITDANQTAVSLLGPSYRSSSYPVTPRSGSRNEAGSRRARAYCANRLAPKSSGRRCSH
jgi:hypothetical protein